MVGYQINIQGEHGISVTPIFPSDVIELTYKTAIIRSIEFLARHATLHERIIRNSFTRFNLVTVSVGQRLTDTINFIHCPFAPKLTYLRFCSEMPRTTDYVMHYDMNVRSKSNLIYLYKIVTVYCVKGLAKM